LDKDAPVSRPVQRTGVIRSRALLGGLHHHYGRVSVFGTHRQRFGHFIRSLRLDHAAQLLRQQTSIKASLPLTEVAYACGYRDYAHFARNFRARFGCAPGASRGWISSGRPLNADT
jgi:AraC-like DNA-binding protein